MKKKITSRPDLYFQTIAYTSTMGHISKTVYNPVAIKAKAKAELTSPTAVKAADFVSRMEAVKQSETIKKVST